MVSERTGWERKEGSPHGGHHQSIKEPSAVAETTVDQQIRSVAALLLGVYLLRQAPHCPPSFCPKGRSKDIHRSDVNNF